MTVEQVAEIQKMSQLPLADRPEAIAKLVHSGQLDKARRPYIDHPRRVSENVQILAQMHSLSVSDENILVAAAWLHDVIEDSGKNSWPKVSAQDLATWGVSPEAIEIVELLTRSENCESNKEVEDARYYSAIKAHPLARLAKIADMADNCNRQRVKWLNDLGKESKVAKYLPALTFFELNKEEQNWFDERVNSACELNGLDEEEYLRYFVRHDQLFCLGNNLVQARFNKSEKIWIKTFDLFDWIIKGDSDLDQVSLVNAQSSFPGAFPMKMKEGN